MAQVVVNFASFDKSVYNGGTYYHPTSDPFTIPANEGITGAVLTYVTQREGGAFRDRSFQLNAARATAAWITSGAALDHTLLSTGANTCRFTFAAKSGDYARWSISSIVLTITYNPVLVRTPATMSSVILSGDAYKLPSSTSALAYSGANGQNNVITGYKVQRRDNGGAWYDVTIASGTNVTTPAAGNYYQYQVMALAPHGNSAYKLSPIVYSYSVASVTSVALSATYVVAGTAVNLSWVGSSGHFNGITSYNILQNGAAYKTGQTSPLSVPSHATSGSSYYYTVVAVAPRGNVSTNSPSVYSYVACTAPTAVSAASTNVAPGAKVNINWSGAGNGGTYNAISTYQIWRSTSPTSGYTHIDTKTASPYSATAPSSNGGVYYYKILTVGARLSSGQSSVYATLTCSFSAPTMSTVTMEASTATRYKLPGSTIPLAYSGAAGTNNSVSSYKVQRRNNGGAWGDVSISSGTQVTTPAAGQYYQYQVMAVGAHSNSAYKLGPVVYSYSVASLSSVVLAGSASAQYRASGADVILSWAAANGHFNSITSYTVQISDNGGAWANHKTGLTAKSLTVKAKTTAGHSYKYQVIAYAPLGNTAWVESPLLYTYSAPKAPTTVTVSPTTALTGGAVTVSFSGAAVGVGVNISKYEIYIGSILQGNTTTGSINLTAPATAGTHVYKVKAIGNVSGYDTLSTASATLTVLNPKSTGVLNKSTVPMDGASTIKLTISSASTAFTHKAVWYSASAGLAGNTVTIDVAAGVKETTLTVPLAWNNAYPSSTNGTGNVRLETYQGGVKVGEITYTYTVTVPTNIVPSLTSIASAISPSGGLNRYIQFKSKANLSINGAAGAYSSTISSYGISGPGVAVATATTLSPLLATAGTIKFTATVTDSRGRKATAAVSIVVHAYASPSLSGASAYRSDGYGTKDGSGKSVRLIAKRVYSSIDGQNTHSLQGRVYMKGATPGAFTNMTDNAQLVLGGQALLVTKSYVAEIKVADYFTSYTMSFDIPTEAVAFNAIDGATGAAVGKYAENPDLFDSQWKINARGNPVLDMPIGFVYTSIVNVSPQTLHSGTWVALTNQTIFGATVYAWKRTV